VILTWSALAQIRLSLARKGQSVKQRVRGSLPAVAAAACLLLWAGPARAGHYEIDANQPTGSGTVTVTAEPNNSYHYSGYYPAPAPQSLSSLGFYADAAYGTIDYEASETWSFHWVPDMGMTIEQDPPVDDTWEITYTRQISFSFPPQGYDLPGSGGGWISVEADEYGGTGEAIPAVWDYMTLIEPRQENTSWTGTAEVVVGFVLSGANPSVTITARGGGTVDEEMVLAMSLGGGQPAQASEMIRHTRPLDDNDPGVNQTYPVNQSVDVYGEWRGINGQQYRIFQQLKQGLMGTNPSVPTVTTTADVAEFDTNPPTSDGGVHDWTGNDVTPVAVNTWTSIVTLKRKNAQGMYTSTGKKSFRNFVVVAQ
jgi:hypothetical protein